MESLRKVAPLLACIGSALVGSSADAGTGKAANTVAAETDRCAALAGLRLPGLGRITSATSGPAELPPGPFSQPALALAPHCEVLGVMQERQGQSDQHYAIRYRLRLPANWNGRFLFQGGGGTNGVVGNAVGADNTSGASALARGFAVVAQDSGHDNKLNFDPAWGGQTAFGTDPIARANYGHASLPLVTMAAKAVIARYYGKRAEHSYFLGCSKGGQEGMAAAQRYPTLFDGIVAAAPGFALPRAALNQAWSVQQFAGLAQEQTGKPATVAALSRTFSPKNMQLVRQSVLDACDAADGIADGITTDFRQCRGDRVLNRLHAQICRPGMSADCLTASQVDTLARVMTGPRNAAGRAIYAEWTWDGGIGSAMWSMWRTGSEQLPAFDVALGGASLPTVFSVPPMHVGIAPDDILAMQLGYRFPDIETVIYRRAGPFRTSAWQDIAMHSANLDGFFAHGGKLLVPHGVSDPVFSVMDTLAWRDRVVQRYGARTDDGLRVFPVPGMAHCMGGPATSHYDALGALVDWVEQRKAPDNLIATADTSTPWPGRTRPVCAWPKVARYRSGDPERAESFACE